MNDIFDIDKLGRKSLQTAILSGLGGLIVILALIYSSYQLHLLEEKKQEAQGKLTQAILEKEKVDKEIGNSIKELNKLQGYLKEAKKQLPLDDNSKVIANVNDALNSANKLELISTNTQKTEISKKVAGETAKDVYKDKEKLYYVIAMTSSTRDDIENEIIRVKKKVGTTFEEQFPDIETFAPEGGLWTLLISGKSLPFPQANELKQRAIKAGFNGDTWLWQSSVDYFSSK